MYTLEGVQKCYGNNLVLREINCTIPLDGLVVIMGPSGAGKSTLLRLLSFLETPDRGSLRLEIGGQQFDSVRSERPWPIVTCVFQRQFLWPHLTLRDNIALPLRAAAAIDIEAKLNAVIELFDMSSFVDRFPNEVSAGQAQRGALARALVLKPQIILLDEAHFGLDLEQQKILNDHLIKLRDSGVSLIVITHSLDFARKYAERIFIVEGGVVTETGGKGILKEPKSAYLRRAVGISQM
jgi:ABC-type Fe3+/spermidine/putrescine transport system ATPase subunit